ncbi:MAG: hypothetical protein M1825_004390 [Sarcosagium campestre]|nr:MAG: hypothetical protein M1825_004390 [Sarcosagium campestre]
MAKRPAYDDPKGDDGERFRKRKKSDSQAHVVQSKADDIQTAAQLQQLLTPTTDSAESYRLSVKTFKSFLKSISFQSVDDSAQNVHRKAILLEYLRSQLARSNIDHTPSQHWDLLQSWTFAARSDDEALLAAIPDVLSLLLRKISTAIEFRPVGLAICKEVLQYTYLRVIARGTSVNKKSGQLISPCLCLLTELVSFDGGAYARKVYAERDFTFKSLGRNLMLAGTFNKPENKQKRRSSVRRLALNFLFTNFRLQEPAAVIEILGYRDIISSVFREIEADSPEIIWQILDAFTLHIIKNEALPKRSRGRFLSEWTLSRIATLYGFPDVPQDGGQDHKSVEETAHECLMLVCTTPGLGVLYYESGWYLPGADHDELGSAEGVERADPLNLGLDRPGAPLLFEDGVPHIRNYRLASFAQNLRPYANVLQKELLVRIFEVAPELVADYFFRRKSMNYDPKLTAQWIGHTAFVLSTLWLPVPKFLGRKEDFARHPPPVEIIIENILPTPLKQKALSRCLNHASDLITLFSVRLLVTAFQKLSAVLGQMKLAAKTMSHTWHQAAIKLVDEFCRRCPSMKDVITAFRRIPDENHLQREAVTRLLAMYYRATPQVALDEKFDVSVALAKALGQFQSKSDRTPSSPEDVGLRQLELEHLLYIARCSPNMRWWNKPEQIQLSPFCTLLKLLVNLPKGSLRTRIYDLLYVINQEVHLIQTQTVPSSLNALAATLGESTTDDVWGFLDRCVCRFVRKPVLYEDKLDRCSESGDSQVTGGPVSLLLFTISEQWQFVSDSATVSDAEKLHIASWIAMVLGSSCQSGEDETIIRTLCDELSTNAASQEIRSIFKRAIKRSKNMKIVNLQQLSVIDTEKPLPDLAESPPAPQWDDDDDGFEASKALGEEDQTAVLLRLVRRDVSDLVDDGDVARLIMCLCDEKHGVRHQAITALLKFIAKLDGSTYEEREMLALLLRELHVTAEPMMATRSMPTFLAAFAARAVRVEADPQHHLYATLNTFLLKGPKWDMERVPLVNTILLQPPDAGSTHAKDVEWLLSVLLDGLRTPQDMAVYRRTNIFEQLGSLYCLPSLSISLRQMILKLVGRASTIDGGSTTLITRTGILTWINSQIALQDELGSAWRRVLHKVTASCDQERVKAWNGGRDLDEVFGL